MKFSTMGETSCKTSLCKKEKAPVCSTTPFGRNKQGLFYDRLFNIEKVICSDRLSIAACTRVFLRGSSVPISKIHGADQQKRGQHPPKYNPVPVLHDIVPDFFGHRRIDLKTDESHGPIRSTDRHQQCSGQTDPSDLLRERKGGAVFACILCKFCICCTPS